MSETATLPIGADPKNIGKVVSIQIFHRVVDDPDTLKPETLEKHVGNLQSYTHTRTGFTFRLVGGSGGHVIYKKQYVEIHTLDRLEK